MYNRIIILAIFVATSTLALAQGYTDDVLRYSRTSSGGTARSQGIAGAQTAIGGDIGSLSANPAGLGFFRHSDFSLTPTLTSNKLTSTYQGTSVNNSKSNLEFSNLGVVWATTTPQADQAKKTSGWLSYSFGVGYNKNTDFNSDLSFRGRNANSSFTYFLADEANSIARSQRDGLLPPPRGQSDAVSDENIAGQAYNGYLINANKDAGGATTYYPAVDLTRQNPVSQAGNLFQAGSTNEVNLSFGTNYGNQLYLGVGANISSLHYTYGYSFIETGINDLSNSTVSSLKFTENFEAAGTGFSAKVGLIYRPNESFRLGTYIQTPTWYHITESTNNAQVLGVDNTGVEVYRPDPATVNSETSYKIKTPFRYNFGTSYFFGTSGFISADIELIDYSAAKATFEDPRAYDASLVSKSLRSTVNYRIGGEVKLNSVVLRAGYAFYGNPYSQKGGLLPNSQENAITGGVGYRFKNVYVDAAVVGRKYNSSYAAYVVDEEVRLKGAQSGTADIKNTRTDFTVTLGTRF